MSEPRKATDVLLNVESKIDLLLGMVRSQDLVIKVLSNKLNDVVACLDKQQASPSRITVEAVQNPMPPTIIPAGFTNIPAGDPERNIPFVAESQLPQTNSPQGFRRNSRPETYATEKSKRSPVEEVKMPVQMPPNMPAVARQNAGVPPPGRGNDSSVAMSPQSAPSPKKGSGAVVGLPALVQNMEEEQSVPMSAQGQVPVTQRCVDKNGKSIFLANVEIMDLATNQNIFKTRTNAAGKWMASLGVGSYRVTIRKLESVTKDKIEAVQDFQVDGSQGKMELPMLIIK